MRSLQLFFLSVLLPVCSFGQGLISTVAGTGVYGYNGDWIQATSAQLSYSGKTIIDKEGNLYISDVNRIRRVDRGTGIITTICGNGIPASTGDGGLAVDAQIDSVFFIAMNSAGDIFLSEMNIPKVRKIEKATGIITTYAGSVTAGFSGDGGPAADALFHGTYHIAMDKNDNLYISDMGRIRKVTPDGIVNTIAGTGTVGNAGNGGPALQADISAWALNIDTSGNIYFLTSGGKVRKIDAGTGIIEHFAGGGTGYGDGGPATDANLNGLLDITSDRFGNIYLPMYGHSRIRKVSASGIISTVAGGGSTYGDGIAADTCSLSYPANISTDSCGNLYIMEAHPPRLRKVTYDDCYPLSVVSTEKKSEQITVWPNSASTSVTVSSSDKISFVAVVDVTGRVVLQSTVNSEQITVDVSGLSSGVYFVTVREAQGDVQVVRFVRE